MLDREVVGAIVAGNPAGLAAAYDKYADELYGYCRTLLREPADAADAVHDTYVIAAVNLNRLRDPERLRPWLYAVARNLCLRRLRADKATELTAAPETVGEETNVGGDAERAELRALLRAAGGGLNPGERDIVELRLWQGLDAAEAAAVLGITRGHAHSLLSRGRDQLTASVAALLVARSGREDCAGLDRLLSSWDGQMTVLLRKRLSRHIEHCDICSDRRRRELRPALLTLWPAATLAGAALAEHAIHAGAPEALRAQVLSAAASQDAHATASAAGLGAGHGFGGNGFPKPATHQILVAHRALLSHGTRTQVTIWGAAGTAAAVIAATVFAGALGHRGGGTGHLAGPPGSVRSSGPATAGAAPTGSPGGQRTPGSAQPGGPGGPGSGSGPGSGGGAVPVVALSPGAGPEASVAPGAPVASGSAPASAPPSAAPPPSSPPSSSQPAPPPAAAAGTLTVSPGTVVLTPVLGSTLTITAHGGPVSWSISEPGSLLGKLVVSPSAGTLAAGQSVQVSISVSGLASLDTTLTVNPGGHPVTVTVGLGLLAR
jgi:RNA polymerase sigma factor (sigma-70 family)